jgi:hypothetical protein
MPDLNLFNQQTAKGQVDASFPGMVFTCKVKSDEATPLVAGQAVKLVDSSTGVPEVTALAADTDETYGFVLRNPKDEDYSADKFVEIASKNSVVYMEAGAAIARGAFVEVSNATKKVITKAGINPVVGYAFDKATEDGDLIRVYINTPNIPAV